VSCNENRKVLSLLSRQYSPPIQSVCTEIINLNAILHLAVKGTELTFYVDDDPSDDRG